MLSSDYARKVGVSNVKIGLTGSSCDPLTHSHPRLTSDADCCSLLLSGHLLLLSDHRGILLLLKEGPGFEGLGLKVLVVSDEANRIDDTIVIKEHTSDLTGGLAILLLDDRVNVVANLLTAVSGLKTLDALEILLADKHLWLLLLLLLLLSGHHLLLLEHLSLLSSHLACRLGLSHLRLVLRGLVTLTAIILALVVVVAVVELTTLAVRALATLALVGTLRAVAVLALTAHVLHTSSSILSAEHVAKEILLNLLEAALLTLLVKFLGRHPELNGERARAKWSRLVESLDGSLGAVDVLVKDEVLTVGSSGVEVLALTEFDRNHGSD